MTNSMDWYSPLMILPAIGLIILSTSNFLISLNTEIRDLELEKVKNDWVINQKIKQLRKLGIANALLYVGALFFMFSSLTHAFYQQKILFKSMMIIATLFVTLALSLLFWHSVKGIHIKQQHLKK